MMRFDRRAVPLPRRITALPLFRHSATASAVTLGRPSYTTAITPSGTRVRRIWSPFGRVRPPSIAPTGSGSLATARTPAAISATRSSSSSSRSISAGAACARLAASTSFWFSRRISAERRSRASAISASAASR